MTISASIDWNTILLALIAAAPGIIAAYYSGKIHKQIKTPSGKPIGAQVEDTLHTAIVNNHHLVGAAEGARKVASDLAVERATKPRTPPDSPGDTQTTSGGGA
jgi:hypothetical protein